MRTGKLKLWGCKSLAQGQKLHPNLPVIKASYTLDVCLYNSEDLGSIRIENRGIEKKLQYSPYKDYLHFSMNEIPNMHIIKNCKLEIRSSAKYPSKGTRASANDFLKLASGLQLGRRKWLHPKAHSNLLWMVSDIF